MTDRNTAYSQLINTVHYPDFDAPLWVVIDRITEKPTRIVESIYKVRQHSEIALPLPSGELPEKSLEVPYMVQYFDHLSRPVYWTGSTTTTEDVDGNGVPYEPYLVPVQEEVDVTLRDAPELFTLDEVIDHVKEDILRRYPFYDQIHFILFDDRLDSLALFGDQYESTGFGAGSIPWMVGPVQPTLGSPDGSDEDLEVLGHLMLMAPNVSWANYFFQIRHGVDEGGGHTGPLVDIQQASRQSPPEVYRIKPFQDFALTTSILRNSDATGSGLEHSSYFWVRSSYHSEAPQIVEGHVVPWMAILIRTTGVTEG